MPPLNAQWRSLRELERDPVFLDRAAQEFPGLADPLASPVERRRVLRLMAASFAMAGLSGCGEPDGVLIPPVRQPAGLVPSVPDFYTSASLRDGYADGIVVRHWMGRPIKVEGNPNHPASLGATSAISQALVLDFYDPHRRAALALNDAPADQAQLLTALAARRATHAADRGAGLRILTGTVTSPTLARQLDALLAQYPEARWHRWDAVSRDAVREGALQAYGAPVAAVARLEEADVVLAIDSDLLDGAPGHLRFARELASRRNPARAKMSRIYAIEPTPSAIGAIADHRIVAGPREIHAVLLQSLAAIVPGRPAGSPKSGLPGLDQRGDRRSARHARPVRSSMSGRDQPASRRTRSRSRRSMKRSDGRGNSVRASIESPEHRAAAARSRRWKRWSRTCARAGSTTLLMLDINPVYAAPGALGFADALKRVPFSLALSAPSPDETARAATWFVPMTHAWEAWSDARAFDGAATIVQPQALPLYDGTSAHEMLALVSAGPDGAERTQSRSCAKRGRPDGFGDRFDDAWSGRRSRAAWRPDTASPEEFSATLRPDAARAALPPPPEAPG